MMRLQMHITPLDLRGQQSDAPILVQALHLARLGYYVHPLCWPDADGHCACGRHHADNKAGKAPLAPTGSDIATRDEATIRAWWARWPRANIGINAELSGIVDIAPDSSLWAAQFKANGMPPTVLYRSGGGSGRWHAWYRRPIGCPAVRVCKTGEYDIMAAGNTVAPPSRHRSGRPYVFVDHHDLLPVDALPEAPSWAVEILQTRGWIGPVVVPEIDMESVAKRRGNLEVIIARVMKTLPGMAKAALDDYTSAPSPSEARFRVIGGIMQLPNDEIVALIHYWADEGKLPWGNFEKKGIAKQTAEILRCIGKHEARMLGNGAPRISSPTRSAGLLPSKPLTKSRARNDRPQTVDSASLFAYYRREAHSGVVLMRVPDIAAALGTSVSTITRIEKQLVQAGLISARVRGRLGVRLTPKTLNIATSPSTPLQTSQPKAINIAAVTDFQTNVLPHSEAQTRDQTAMYNHAPPSITCGEDTNLGATPHVMPVPASRLDLLVADFLDTRAIIDPATGELQQIHTANRCIAYVEARAPGCWPAATIRIVYDQMRQARQKDIWREERAKLRAIQTPEELEAHIEVIQRRLTRNAGRHIDGWWHTRLIMAEEERRKRGWARTADVEQTRLNGGEQDAIEGERDCISTPKLPLTPTVDSSLSSDSATSQSQAALDAFAYRACRPLHPPNVNDRLRRLR